MTTQKKRKIFVIGHKNPDTDSICSAIAYAELKNRTCGPGYEPCCAGDVNRETEFLLERFHTPIPRFCPDVHAQVQDMEIRQFSGVDSNLSLRDAWEIMRNSEISTLPVTLPNGKLAGIISLKDLAVANLDVLDTSVLSKAGTSFDSIAKTLNGYIVTGDGTSCLEHGKVIVGAGSPDKMESMVEPGDLVLVANRYESQLCAIELEASCIVVCMDQQIAKTIIKLAKEHNCTIISTPYDTYTAACLIKQSVPVSYYMLRDNLLTFHLSTPVDVVKKIMGEVRLVYFPVLDAKDCYVGMISRRNLLNLQRKQLILVDHNEKSQCVDGWEDADILEVIDHHRLGTLETSSPVYFRNQPVGCTATIIYQMYREHSITPTENVAGLLAGAILSDTLMFHSPTCTKSDEQAAKDLAAIAGIDLNELFGAMMQAGENLTGRSAEDIFMQDYKAFTCGKISFGVGQSNFFSWSNRTAALHMLRDYLPAALDKQRVDMIFYMLTSPANKSSEVLCVGEGAAELLCRVFHVKAENDLITLPGVLSRKQQMIPALMEALR